MNGPTREQMHAKLQQLSGQAIDLSTLSDAELRRRLGDVQSQILPGVNAAVPVSDAPDETQGDPALAKPAAVEHPPARNPSDIEV